MAVGVAAGDAGGGGVGQRGGASGSDDAPLGAGELGEALADALHQLVDLDVLAGGGFLGGADLGQLERAADDGEGAAAVDERAHADGAVDVGTDAQGAGVGGGGAGGGAKESGEGGEAAPSEQLAAGEGFPGG